MSMPQYHICVFNGQHKSNGAFYYDCDMYTLADRLKWARLRAGLSQEQLGDKAGVSQSTIGNLEAGTRSSARRLPQIADILGVNALWLAEGEGKPTPDADAGASYDSAVSSASGPAKALIDAILQADKAGEPGQTFALMLRMLPGPDKLGAGD
ncbi:helix-turn-helix domain-containing protein [Burkholderia seminalis]|uniref:helix-turn-helix domain-containing protein n=1 Tax=Burkholderia seminalis TaxID=488731 RepID=UPI001CF290EF|nr:helix-turn-helix transcriptional regulator [Burkholderia seminalis]MCA7953886.1 helix-turn-helix domain-containing protein [Burkholderia seminalis]